MSARRRSRVGRRADDGGPPHAGASRLIVMLRWPSASDVVTTGVHGSLREVAAIIVGPGPLGDLWDVLAVRLGAGPPSADG